MHSERRIVLALFAIALGLRVLYGAVLTTQPDLIPPPYSSDLFYAKEILSGTRWITEPSSPRSPGYPVVLAALYLLSFKQLWLVTFFQAVIGALTVVAVYWLGRYLLGTLLAVVAALWFALHVFHMHLSYELERDILAVFLLMVTLLLVVRPFKQMRYAIVGGLVCAALVHVDPQYLLLIPVFLVFILFKTRHGLINLQYLFLFLSVVVIASTPWTIRNYAVYQEPIPVGMEARRFLRPAKVVVTEPERGFSNLESKIVMAARTQILQRNAAEFWRFARFRGEQASDRGGAQGTTAQQFVEPPWSLRHNLVSIFNFGLAFPFFLVGVVFAVRRRNRTGMMLAAAVLAYFVLRTYLGGNERARLPIDPLVIMMAFYGLAELARVFKRSPEASEKQA